MERRAPDELRTARLLLRRWRPEDAGPLAAMNADPEVMRWIGGGPLDRGGSDALMGRLEREWRERGHGLWALRGLDDGAFCGFCGLAVPSFLPAVLPAVEIGWRLPRARWGAGLAREAAAAAVAVGFGDLALRRLLAIVHPENARSLALARALGMRAAGQRTHPGTGWRLRVLALDRPGPPDARTSGTPRHAGAGDRAG